jgi:hypothetical protein
VIRNLVIRAIDRSTQDLRSSDALKIRASKAVLNTGIVGVIYASSAGLVIGP